MELIKKIQAVNSGLGISQLLFSSLLLIFSLNGIYVPSAIMFVFSMIFCFWLFCLCPLLHYIILRREERRGKGSHVFGIRIPITRFNIHLRDLWLDSEMPKDFIEKGVRAFETSKSLTELTVSSGIIARRQGDYITFSPEYK